MSFYRPGDYQPYPPSLHDLPPPPPLLEMPPLPRDPPPPMNTYRGGDSWRPSDREPSLLQRNEFTFRNNDIAPQYPRDGDQYRPTRSKQYAMRENGQGRSQNQYRPERNRDDRSRRNQTNLNQNQRGRGYRTATADRPLLKLRRGDTPEQMLGMADDQNGARRFLPADDVSDSGEEQMDESNSDIDEVAAPTAEILQGMREEDAFEPPPKRRALEPSTKGLKDANGAPQWSNPDPYTVLPPLDESQRKRKDVVKIIRKARIISEIGGHAQNQVVDNDDFISFGLEEEDASADEAVNPFSNDKNSAYDVRDFPEAPQGPRQFSHLHHLHGPGHNTEIPYSVLDAQMPGVDTSSLYQSPKLLVESGNFSLDIPDYNTALGNRKRTHDDEIRDELPHSKKRKPGMPSGSILQDWMPRRGTHPTPWLARDDKPTENAGFRLHKEICDFYEYVRPQKFEQTVREELLDRLQIAVRKHLPECNIHCFGSFAAGLYLPNADMDLVIISDQYRNRGQKLACQTNGQMRKFGRYLQDAKVAKAGSVEVIVGAKVPIVKFVDRITSIKVDVSFENDTGLIANETFSAWKKHYPAMPILVTLIKQFLMMRGLNEVMNGGLGGFSVTCLVTSMLQNMPRVQAGELIPEEHLGEMLIEFLDLYGNRLDITRTGIMMNPPGYFNKHEFQRSSYRTPIYQANKADRLAIMDPNKRDNDVSGGSRNVSLIFGRFSRAHTELLKAMRLMNRPSLLDWLLGGEYEAFTWQRNHLLGLYKQRWGDRIHDSKDLQEATRDSPNRLVIECSSTKEHNSCLYPNLFVNPVMPGVVNPFPKPTAKAKNAVKPNQKKANKLLERNTAGTLKPHGKGTSQEQHPNEAPSILESRSSKKDTSERRASTMKREYPDIVGVGNSITKKRRQRLLAQHKAKFPDVTAKASTNAKKPKHGKASADPALPTKQSKTPRRAPLPPVREEMLANVFKTPGGASNEDPIPID